MGEKLYLGQAGKAVSGFALVEEAEVRETRAQVPAPYLSLKLTNGSESIFAKQWDFCGVKPKSGDCIYVEGVVSEFKGKAQITVSRFRLAEDDETNAMDFMPCLPSDEVAMYTEELDEMLLDNKYKEFCDAVFSFEIEGKTIREWFLIAPAASKNHHAYINGLLEHSVNVAKKARALADVSTVSVDKDLITVGAVFHDIGKIISYEYNTPPIKRSNTGRLLDHLVAGMLLIETTEAGKHLPKDKYRHLQHIISSHHGKQEMGSPTEPQTIEAQIIHFADYLDAQEGIYRTAYDMLPEGEEWSAPVYALDGRRVWRPKEA